MYARCRYDLMFTPIREQHLSITLLKSITQKGNAFMGLGQFDAAKECYESLRTFGDNTTADSYLEKLDDAQERDASFCFV